MQVGAQSAQALAGDQLDLDGDERSGAGLLQGRRLARAQAVRPPLPCVQDAPQLLVVVQPRAADEIGIEGIRGGLQHGGIDVQRAGQRVHLRRQPGQGFVHQEMRAFPLHLAYEAVIAQQGFLEEAGKLHVANAQVVFGPGQGEFLGRDPPVEQMPGPGFFLLRHPLTQPVGVEAGDQRFGADASTAVIEPQGGFAGDGGKPVPGEMRVGVGEAGGIVPHLAGMADLPAQLAGHPPMKPAIGEGVRAIEHAGRHRPVLGPVGAYLLVAAVDTAHGEHHYRRLQAYLSAAPLADRRGAIDPSGLAVEPDDAVLVQQLQATAAVGGMQGGDQAPHEFAAGAPDDVIARQTVALAVTAAFHPVHRGHEFHAQFQQPVVDLGTAAFDIVAGPLPRVLVIRCEFAEAQPVAQRRFRRVRNLHPRLQGRADQGHAAERPQGQAP
ncbi:hypothetical protein BAY1663_04326 [Pseudomonas sp. BAY1663]|nr:hypothetical protein BAY1663_04326 [Pseudomonas sp. BAY1663]